MNTILDLINETPIEELYEVRIKMNNYIEERIKDAVKSVKFNKVNDNIFLSYEDKNILCKPSKHGYNIYSAPIGKNGKLIKGELIKKETSSSIYTIKQYLRFESSWNKFINQ